jgi:hypothetical protein
MLEYMTVSAPSLPARMRIVRRRAGSVASPSPVVSRRTHWIGTAASRDTRTCGVPASEGVSIRQAALERLASSACENPSRRGKNASASCGVSHEGSVELTVRPVSVATVVGFRFGPRIWLAAWGARLGRVDVQVSRMARLARAFGISGAYRTPGVEGRQERATSLPARLRIVRRRAGSVTCGARLLDLACRARLLDLAWGSLLGWDHG